MAPKSSVQTNGFHKSSNQQPYFWLTIVTAITVFVSIPSVFVFLRETSLEYIILIRKSYSHPIADFSMNLLTNIADKYGISISFCISQVLLSSHNSQVLLASSCLGVSVNIAVKMLIRDARPYFYSDNYVPVSCDFEYGSPSGHSQAVTSFFLTLVTLLLREYNVKKGKTFIYVFTVVYCFFISFTRIFVGLHTLEQILTGLGLGIIIHLLMAHVFSDYFERLFKGIETGKTRFINVLTILYFVLNMWAIGMYVMIDNYLPTPQFWLDTIAKS
jgi:membrane-associated phospholipid phosphatase